MTWNKIEKSFSRDSYSVALDSSLAKPCPLGWITSIQIVNNNRCCTHVNGWFEPKNSGWFGTHRVRSTQARDSASPPKKQKNNLTTKGYTKPFCSDGGSVILSTLITAPRRGCIHPASLSFWFPFPFSLLAAGGTTSPCQAKGSTGYGETETQWKSRKSKGKDTNGYDKSFD